MKSLNKKMMVLAAIAAASTSALAYETGDIIVRAGYAAVDPRDSSSDLDVAGLGGKVANTGVGVDGAAALGLTVSYMFTPHVGIELLAATPFEHDITSKGLGGLGVADGTVIGSTKQLPPTVSVQYYFAQSTSAIQPYVGLGLNYTTFFEEGVSSGAKSALGASNLSLDDSYGLAVEAGVDWNVGNNWVVNASVWHVQIETDASLDTALGKVKTTVSIDPWVYMVGVGYKF
ncbi:MAG: OmpW family outer membrane protein [Spongiibacteraceae bacterium]